MTTTTKEIAAEYRAFIEEALDGFDENSSSEVLARTSEKLGRLRVCFLSGDPMQPGEGKLVKAASNWYRVASVQQRHQVGQALEALSDLCFQLSIARKQRLRGMIEAAQRREAKAESLYRSLPPEWKW